MLPDVPRRLLILTLTLMLAGGHAELLQLAAWCSMLWRFSAETSLSDALSRTFDGRSACPMCHAAEALRETPREPAAPAPPGKAQKITKVDAGMPDLLVVDPPVDPGRNRHGRAIDPVTGPGWMGEPPEPVPIRG